MIHVAKASLGLGHAFSWSLWESLRFHSQSICLLIHNWCLARCVRRLKKLFIHNSIEAKEISKRNSCWGSHNWFPKCIFHGRLSLCLIFLFSGFQWKAKFIFECINRRGLSFRLRTIDRLNNENFFCSFFVMAKVRKGVVGQLSTQRRLNDMQMPPTSSCVIFFG